MNTKDNDNANDIAGELLELEGPTEAAAVAEITRESVAATTLSVKSPDGARTAELLVLPSRLGAYSVKKFLDEYKTAPERRKGTAELTDLESFIAHVRRFKDEDSALFADRNPTAPSLTAVLDYHRINESVEGSDTITPGAPRFGEHRARYAFPLSDEWVAWRDSNTKKMNQADFAAFLEDRIADVCDPTSALDTTRAVMEQLLCAFASPSRLLDLARGLTIRVNSNVSSHQNLKSGETVMRFDTQHQDERGAPIEIPGAFLIGLPVFRDDVGYQLAARLRYRVKENVVSFFYELYRATQTFDFAFKEACARASKETELPLFMGKPEPVST